MNFECHITLNLADANVGNFVAEQVEGWHTSQSERDPVLGKDSYFYLTAHDTDYVRMYERMKYVAKRVEGYQTEVVRQKIELIMYDTRGDAQ